MATSRVSATTKGAARILRTIISATSRKIRLVCASMIIVPLKKSGYKDVELSQLGSKCSEGLMLFIWYDMILLHTSGTGVIQCLKRYVLITNPVN